MNEVMTGGCQCGRVRYAVVVTYDTAELCHCGMCKRATGGVAAALKPVKRADLTWTAAAPDLYRSSPIAERPFCAACGSPLGFRYLDSEEMELTVGSFDDPTRSARPRISRSRPRCPPGWTLRTCRPSGSRTTRASWSAGRRRPAGCPTDRRPISALPA